MTYLDPVVQISLYFSMNGRELSETKVFFFFKLSLESSLLYLMPPRQIFRMFCLVLSG